MQSNSGPSNIDNNSQDIYPNNNRNNTNVHNINRNIAPANPQAAKFLYYVTPLIKGFTDPSDTSYFSNLAREHLMQTMQAMSFTRVI